MTRFTQFIVLIFALASIAGFSGGCATIINGSTQAVPIASSPSGATIELADGQKLRTPTTIEFERKRDHVISISMDGYHTEQVTLMRTMSGAVAGNILAGGFIGWGVDAISGAQYKLLPATVSVNLRPLKEGESNTVQNMSNALSPESRLRQLEQLRSDGLVTDDEYEATRKAILKEIQGG